MNLEKAEEVFDRYFDAAEKWYPYADFVRRHSKRLASAARLIAEKMQEQGNDTIDPEVAYMAGLLHDIGKTKKDFYGLDHPIIGYKILKEEGLEEPARIAMTHTYYGYPEIDRSEFWEEMQPEDLKFTREYLDKTEQTDLDRLIQLLDNMSHQFGMMTVSDRFADILIRHNIREGGAHLKELYKLKMYFDEKCGMNIYKLFESDIIRTALKEPNEPDVE